MKNKYIISAIALMFSAGVMAKEPSLMDKVKAASAPGAPVTSLSEQDYDAFTLHIEKGEQDWIGLVPAYAKNTDGGYSEGLAISLARGLTTNPSAVLAVLNTSNEPPLGLDDACGIPFIEITDADARKYVKATLPKLHNVTAPELTVKRDSCIKQMNQLAAKLNVPRQ